MPRYGILSWIVLLSVSGFAQPAPSNSAYGIAVAHRSLAKLTQGAAVRDVTLMGTVQRIAGSDDESGGIIAKALATGDNRVDYNYASGRRAESRTFSTHGTIEKWSGSDQKERVVVPHNVAPLSPWFSPALLLQAVENASDVTVSYVGKETRGRRAVEHISIVKQVPALHHPRVMLQLLQKAARVELYVDSANDLPIALLYNAHPDKNLGEDIPVEIRFSDYRDVNGVQIPFQIKKYFNRTLELDIQLTSATLNAGLSASSLQLQ